jgi:hypothetical protein
METISDDMLCSNARSDLPEVAALSIHMCVRACELIPASGGDWRAPLECDCCALPNAWRPTISDDVLCCDASSDPTEGIALSSPYTRMMPTSGGDRRIHPEFGCALPNSQILWRTTSAADMLCPNARCDPSEVTALFILLCVCVPAS